MKHQLYSKSSPSQGGEGREVKQRKKWQLQQTIKYCEFIRVYQAVLEQTEKKQKQRIYNKMAEYVGTRSTHQCRSHHQKVIKRYNSIDGFIQMFTKKIDSVNKAANLSRNDPVEPEKSKRDLPQINKAQENIKLKLKPQSALVQIQAKPLQCSIFQSKLHYPHPKFYENLNSQTGNFQKNLHLVHQRQPYQIYLKNEQPSYFTTEQRPNRQNQNKNMSSHFNPTIVKTIILNYNNTMQTPPYESYSDRQIGTPQFPDDYSYSEPTLHKKTPPEGYHERCKSQNNRTKLQQFNQQQPDHHKGKMKTKQNVILPSYERLKNNPESLMLNASQICSSIIRKQNLNVINPLVQQKQIQLTQERIKIKGKQDEYYKIWVQCVKIQQESEHSQPFSSDSEEIQRELVQQILMDILAKEKSVQDNQNYYLVQKPYRDQMPPLQRDAPPYLFDGKMLARPSSLQNAQQKGSRDYAKVNQDQPNKLHLHLEDKQFSPQKDVCQEQKQIQKFKQMEYQVESRKNQLKHYYKIMEQNKGHANSNFYSVPPIQSNGYQQSQGYHYLHDHLIKHQKPKIDLNAAQLSYYSFKQEKYIDKTLPKTAQGDQQVQKHPASHNVTYLQDKAQYGFKNFQASGFTERMKINSPNNLLQRYSMEPMQPRPFNYPGSKQGPYFNFPFYTGPYSEQQGTHVSHFLWDPTWNQKLVKVQQGKPKSSYFKDDNNRLIYEP